jgi:hypothetical protein
MLDSDLTRCRGEGNAGTVCPRRDQCDRFRAIAEDLAMEERTELRPFLNYSAMLCRPPNWPFFWPADDSQSMAERLRNKGYQPVPDAALRAVMGGSVALDEDQCLTP